MGSSKMAINSLLQDAPSPAPNPHVATQASQAPGPHQTANLTSHTAPILPASAIPPSSAASISAKRTLKARRKEAPLIQRAVTSPHHYNRNMPPTLPPQALAQAQFQPSPSASSGSTLSSNRTINSAHSTPSGEYRSPMGYGPVNTSPPLVQRRTSTEKMDFLAGSSPEAGNIGGPRIDDGLDLASMQYPQQGAPQASRNVRNSAPNDFSRSPSVPALSRRSSALPSQADHPMSDAPTATLQPRTFTATSLSNTDLKTVSDLTKQLSENSFLYDSHTKLIKLLHQGLASHIVASKNPDAFQYPQNYSLLVELRQARDAMDSRFPVGEELWIEWIQDECMLARTIDDRIAVMELCQKAVQDEVSSTKIWRLYGDWMWYLYRTAHDISGTYESNSLEQHDNVGNILARQRWTEDEKVIGREVFGWDFMISVWEQGVKATEWHINESHVVWDPYIEILLHDLSNGPTSEKIHTVKSLFEQRLQQPHATWDDTFQTFSQFVSKHDNASYEQIMVSMTHQASAAKFEYELRQENEVKLQRAAASGDKNTEWTVMTEYLEWEAEQSKRKDPSRFSFDLHVALSQRSNLRFPTDAGLWEDHVDLLTENADPRYPLLPLARNATRHCPWSGNLWSLRLVALEAAGNSYEEIEDVKHHATSSGLLEEVGGMDELIKVYTSWCGFLRRRAFASGAGEDERDMAEVGIRSTIGDVKEIGEKKYGKDFKGDPQFRIHKIYMKFLGQAERYDEGRKTWAQLSASLGDQWEFWDRYYMWEMTAWAKTAYSLTAMPEPEHPTAVLQQAIRRPNLDWPEKMIEYYLHHCAQHESAQKLQEAQVETRRLSKQVIRRRAAEAAEATAAQAASSQAYPSVNGAMQDESPTYGKRKRDSKPNTEEDMPIKKARSNDTDDTHLGDVSASETSQLKRDRENTTIIVKHLPVATSEARLRQFFRDCGAILGLKLVPDEDGASSTATIEFESKEDVLTAQTKSMKTFDGHSIEIQYGNGTTLWVTNYPAEADEAYIRDLFKQFGEIVEVRFPSLKFGTHRRFCYVQFLSSSQAQAATQLDGKALSGNLVLSAKISDPTAKKERTGAMQEGREIFVGNLHWAASDQDLRGLFDTFGAIQHVRILRNMEGRSKGSAFVVFDTAEEANAALEMNSRDFKGRILKVSISKSNAKGAKRTAKTIINTASPVPESTRADSPDVSQNGGPTSPNTVMATDQPTHQPKDHRSRTLTLRHIPDTVNDARIRALMEPYGSLRQIVLRPEKNEASVEFVELKDAGKAEMGVAGHEIMRGVFIEVGQVQGGGGAWRRGTDAESGSVKGRNNGSKPALAPVTARRPGLGGARRGGRGGLGFVRGAISSSNGIGNGDENGRSGKDFDANGQEKVNGAKGPVGEEGGKGKSNAEFRALLAGK